MCINCGRQRFRFKLTDKSKRKSKAYPRYQVDTSQAKCFADVVMLYMRYVYSKLQGHKEWEEYAEHLYKELVRGDIIQNPRTTAAGVLYVAAVMTKTWISQQDIAEALGIAETSVRVAYVKIKIKAQKQGLFT